MHYETALLRAWEDLLAWAKNGRFRPENEEDIQCFLYYGLVTHMQSAIGVKPKPTTASPEKEGKGGPIVVGDMHFPDIMLGEDEVVVEIKFARNGVAPYKKCKDDITKMNKHHASAKRHFFLFDTSPSHVFLDEHQIGELEELAAKGCEQGKACKIHLYPEKANPSPAKAWGRKAWDTMRSKTDGSLS